MKGVWQALPARDEDKNTLAVIEASALSRCKFKFEPDYGVFRLHNVLPTGTTFPYAFGFVPSTLGEDGDPLDILVLTDEPPPVSTVIPCRLVAVLKAVQRENGDTISNDRLLGVAASSERYADCRARSDVDEKILQRISEFFEFYHGLQAKDFEALGWKGHNAAEKTLESGIRAFRKNGSPASSHKAAK